MAKHNGFPFIRENLSEDNGPEEAGAYTAATAMKLFQKACNTGEEMPEYQVEAGVDCAHGQRRQLSSAK